MAQRVEVRLMLGADVLATLQLAEGAGASLDELVEDLLRDATQRG